LDAADLEALAAHHQLRAEHGRHAVPVRTSESENARVHRHARLSKN
jgi:hypothetical protein